MQKNCKKQRLSQLKQMINQMMIQASKKPKIINRVQNDQKSQKQTRLTISTDTFVSMNQNNPENQQKQFNNLRRHLSQSKIQKYDKQTQEQYEQICPKMRKSQTIYQVLKPISNQYNKKSNITQYTSNTSNQQSLSISDFKLIKLIGKGSYGKIHLALHILTNSLYAIKIIPKRIILKQNHLSQFIQQCKNLSLLEHPNITKLYNIFHDYTKIYMLMQYCPDGSLQDKSKKQVSQNNTKKQIYYYLDNTKKQINYTQTQQKKLIKQIVSVLCYMHQNNVIHRDIKLQNVLLSYQQIKLCDFGCSKYIRNQSQLKQTNCGTFIYKSPQQIKKLSYNHKADIWSLGITLYQLVTGRLPYQIDYAQILTQTILLKHMQNIQYPENINEDLKGLLKQMLKINPNQRIGARSMLLHKFFC